MENSWFYFKGEREKSIDNDKKKLDNIEHKILERKKRDIIIDKKYLINLKIDKSFVEKSIQKINEFRNLHGVEPLIQDDYLIKRAFIIAEKKLTSFVGEDLLYKDGNDLGGNFEICDEKLEVEQLIEKWYNENKNYNFIEPIELECNNFTQMIWKNSKKIGIGYYCSQDNIEENNLKSSKHYYAALYYPAGNIPGEYKDNVLKKKINKEINKNQRIKQNKEINPKAAVEPYKSKMKTFIGIIPLIIVIIIILWKLFIGKNQLEE